MTDTDAKVTRTVAYSAVRDQVHLVFPNDLNQNSTVFGGLILASMDRIAAVIANRHAAGPCVTVGVDAVHFIAPARGGDVLIYHASVNRAWNTSLEIGVKVEAELVGGGDRRHILSAYFTFVAQGADGRPRPVPAITPETPDEKHRFEEAQFRREARLRNAEELKKFRQSAGRADK